MNADTHIDLEVLHSAIVADIKAAFPQLVTVEFYQDDPEARKTLPIPACLLTISELEADNEIDPGTEQLAVVATFEAHFIINSIRTPRAAMAIRTLAAAFMAWLRKRRWTNPAEPTRKLPTGPANVVGGFPDDFTPELDKFEVWRVEWQQVIHLGESVWNDEGITPSEVYFSWLPEIGTGNEEDYEKVNP